MTQVTVKAKDSDAFVMVSTIERNTKTWTIVYGYRNTRITKPTFIYRFNTRAEAEKYVTRFFHEQAKVQSSKAAQKAVKSEQRKTAQRNLTVGDILVSSWGYDQTNVDFYEVVALVGSKSVSIKKIAKTETRSTSSMSGYVMPVTKGKDRFLGEAQTKRVNEHGSVKISDYRSARKWEGKEQYVSSYH